MQCGLVLDVQTLAQLPAQRVRDRVLRSARPSMPQQVTELITMRNLIFLTFLGLTYAQYAPGSCPEPYGVQTYPDAKYCDKFFKVRNPRIFLIFKGLKFYFKSVSMERCMRKPAKMVWFTMADTGPFTISAATIGPQIVGIGCTMIPPFPLLDVCTKSGCTLWVKDARPLSTR